MSSDLNGDRKIGGVRVQRDDANVAPRRLHVHARRLYSVKEIREKLTTDDDALFAVACKQVGISHEKKNGVFDSERHARELVEAAVNLAFPEETDPKGGTDEDTAIVGRCGECGKLHAAIVVTPLTAAEISAFVLEMEQDGLTVETMTVGASRSEFAMCPAEETDDKQEETDAS